MFWLNYIYLLLNNKRMKDLQLPTLSNDELLKIKGGGGHNKIAAHTIRGEF